MSITEPVIQRTPAGGYRFSWYAGAEQVLTIVARRIHEKSGSIYAEVSAEHFYSDGVIGKQSSPMLALRVNLSSKRGRDEIIKRLSDLHIERQLEEHYGLGNRVSWQELIEQVAGEIIRREQEGEPVIEITSNDEVKKLEYLIAPIAPLNKPTVLFGDPDSGKSQLLLLLGLIVYLPWTDNHLHLIAPPVHHNILFLDYEADADDLRRQMKHLVDGMGLGYASIYYRRCSLSLSSDFESISSHAQAINADVIFIDSISLACGGELNSTELATSYFRALRQLKATTISVAHTNKDRESKSKTILGSVLFEAGARSVWEVRGDNDKDTLDIGLFHRKANLGAKSKPLGYRFTYNDGGTTVEWYDPKNVAEFIKRMTYAQQVIAALQRGKLSTTQLVEKLQMERAAVDNATSKLKRKNQIMGDSNGWGLPSKDL